MANVKIVLRKEVKKDGTSPLAIRITKDRKSSYIYLDYSIKVSDWDKQNHKVKKSYPNSTRLNNLLLSKLSQATENSLELETSKSNVTANAVKQKIKPKAGATLFAQADLYLKTLEEEGKFNRYSADKPRVKHLKEFLKQDVAFQDITVTLLERFKAYLKKTHNLSERSAVNHLVIVRSIFSQAIKDEVCDPKYYPFGKGKIQIKFPDTAKVGLSAKEVQNLEIIELESNPNHARNLWLVSFYFAGMRVSDLLRLKWSDFQDGRLQYTMGKNDKGGSLKVPEKALKILAQYERQKGHKDDFVFPELKNVDSKNPYQVQRMIASRLNAIDRVLRIYVAKSAKIEKPLTMHIARHTFAQIAGDTIPIQMLQKLYRHSSIVTTIGYQSNFIHKDADDALDSVLTLE